MKKSLRLLLLALTLGAVSIAFCACKVSAQPTVGDMSLALNQVRQAQAIDASISVLIDAGGQTTQSSLSCQVDKLNEEAIAVREDSTSYFLDETVYQNGEMHSSTYDAFVASYARELIFLNVSSGGGSFEHAVEGDKYRYTLVFSNAALGDVFGFLVGRTIFDGDLIMDVFVGRADADVKQVQYRLGFLLDGTAYHITLNIEINAINAAVSLDIPQAVAGEILSYNTVATIALSSDPASLGNLSGGGEYPIGQSATATAGEVYGYTFEGWYQNGQLVSQSPSYTLTVPIGGIALCARYQNITHPITLGAQPQGYGEVVGEPTGKVGKSVSVSAIAGQGYDFIGWYENNVRVSTSASYSFEMPDREVALTARFGEYVQPLYQTSDGVASVYSAAGTSLAHDIDSGKFAILTGDEVQIFSDNMVREHTLNFIASPSTVSADGGVLAVGIPLTKQILLYDLTNYQLIETITTDTSMNELALDGDTLAYCHNNGSGFSAVTLYSISRSEVLKTYSIRAPLFAINNIDGILYVVDTGISRTQLRFIDMQSGETLHSIERYEYNSRRPRFDGKAVHLFGASFDAKSGVMISVSGINRVYNGLNGFEAYKTTFDDGRLSFVLDSTVDEIAVYDDEADRYIYRFPFDGFVTDGVMGYGLYGGRYAFRGGGLLAIVDPSKITSTMEGNYSTLPAQGTVSTQDGVKTLKLTESYTAMATDDNYIYLINSYSKHLFVYDCTDLSVVFSTRYTLAPACVDVGYGKLVVGFGMGKQFWVYDVGDWSHEVVQAKEYVFTVAIYKDLVVYFPADQNCEMSVYSLSLKDHIIDLSIAAYMPAIDINHADGILYIGETGLSSCDLIYVDLNALEVVYCSDFGKHYYNYTKVLFDGKYVHFFGKTYDRLSGEIVTGRQYDISGISEYSTLYDDGSVAVLTATMTDLQQYTIIYDLSGTAVLKQLSGRASAAVRTGFGWVLFMSSTAVSVLAG